jgi:hypothetical protein
MVVALAALKIFSNFVRHNLTSEIERPLGVHRNKRRVQLQDLLEEEALWDIDIFFRLLRNPSL